MHGVLLYIKVFTFILFDFLGVVIEKVQVNGTFHRVRVTGAEL